MRGRLETDRILMEDSRHTIDVVALQTGFADRDRMRRLPAQLRPAAPGDPADGEGRDGGRSGG